MLAVNQVESDTNSGTSPRPLSSEQILANAQALVPTISERADETCNLRHVPSDLIDALREAGVFRLFYPQSWGGAEMSVPQQVELMEMLAYADPAVSWTVKINSDSGCIAGLMDPCGARELFRTVDHTVAGQNAFHGRAIRTKGGYRVTGRWSFASGCMSADVMLGGCRVYDEDGNNEGGPILVLAPASSWQIEDTWHTHGLAGSGSHHYRADDIFIPEHHTIADFNAPIAFKGPLYSPPVELSIVMSHGGLLLGLMQRAIEVACTVAGEKVLPIPPTATPLKDLARVRFAIGQSEMLYGAARAYVYQAVNQLWDECVRDGAASAKTRRQCSFARLYVAHVACDVTQMLFDAIGAPAVFDTIPLGRLMRDATTIRAHVGNSDSLLETLGYMNFGGEPPFL